MPDIYGWFRPGRPPGNSKELLHSMAAARHPARSRRATHLTGHHSAIALAEAGKGGSIAQHGAILAAVYGRPRWQSSGSPTLEKDDSPASSIARAYGRWGRDFLRHLEGDFSIVVIDEDNNQCMLAIDRSGIRPMGFQRCAGGVVFASHGDYIAGHPDTSTAIDVQSIYDYFWFHTVPGPHCCNKEHRRLVPGQYVTIHETGITENTYWSPDYLDNSRGSFASRKREFRTLLENAVESALGVETAGAFLSGGTDSSAIAGLIGAVTGRPARTYSIGFDVCGYDESGYAKIASAHFGTQHHQYFVTPDDVISTAPVIAAAYDNPFGNASAVPTFLCARLAAGDGVSLILGGDGGDELFGGNSRYAKQWLFSLYGRVPSMLRHPLARLAASKPPASDSSSIIAKLQRYIEQSENPPAGRLERYNLVARLGAAQIFTEAFLGLIDADAPLHAIERRLQHPYARTVVERLMALDMKFTLADNDLPKVTRMCEAAGIECAFPMLDDRLVRFAMRLPSHLKLRGTRLRYFYRKALSDFLPKAVIDKKKHGFGLPIGPWLQQHSRLREFLMEGIYSFRSRGIIRPQFIDDLSGPLLDTHAGYYGTLIWVIFMLESWLAAHDNSLRLT